MSCGSSRTRCLFLQMAEALDFVEEVDKKEALEVPVGSRVYWQWMILLRLWKVSTSQRSSRRDSCHDLLPSNCAVAGLEGDFETEEVHRLASVVSEVLGHVHPLQVRSVR